MNVAIHQTRPPETARAASSCAEIETNVAVIGAGPYGLSVSAHLRAAGIETLTFGEPMSFWAEHMPAGMKLRSPWNGAHLSDANRAYTLDNYAKEVGIERMDPLPLDHFIRYGHWFKERAVGQVDRRRVNRIEQAAQGFRLTLDDGDRVVARRVVIALGLQNQEYRPPELAGLPSHLASHTSELAKPAEFAGKRVAVIGAGQSACETAVLLAEAGAEVELISRAPVHWIGSETADKPEGLALSWRIHKHLSPPNPAGPLPLSWLPCKPGLLRLLPQSLQDAVADRCLKPAATAWLVPRAESIAFKPDCAVVKAAPRADGVELSLDDGATSRVDHVVMGTGYRLDIDRFGIIDPAITAGLRKIDGTPVLTDGYEASLPGLHFVGASSVRSFGPQMRFVWGAGLTAQSVTRKIRRA